MRNIRELNGLREKRSYFLSRDPTVFLRGERREGGYSCNQRSVEIAPGIGLADAIFDIVSSGSTLVSNQLREVEVVLPCEALLIANNNLSKEKLEILDELLFRFEAIQVAEGKKYVLLNAPKEKLDEIIEVLPGMKSPTITPLANDEWVSVQSVIAEKHFWEIIGKLKSLGAEGILVLPIEKMIV